MQIQKAHNDDDDDDDDDDDFDIAVNILKS